MHNLGSTLAFSGLGTQAGLSALIMLVRVIQKKPWPTFSQWLNLVLMVGFFLTMFFFTEGSVNQWTGFEIIFTWCTGMYFILPDNKERN